MQGTRRTPVSSVVLSMLAASLRPATKTVDVFKTLEYLSPSIQAILLKTLLPIRESCSASRLRTFIMIEQI